MKYILYSKLVVTTATILYWIFLCYHIFAVTILQFFKTWLDGVDG